MIADGSSTWERDGLGRALTWSTGKDSSAQIYDDLWLIAQSGSVNETYVRDHDKALLSQSVEPNKTEVLLHDLLGTIHGVADKNATTAQLASFSDFGVRIGQPPHRSVFGFVGEVQDTSGDRVHFYARSYDPATGRFFQQDRIDGDLTVPATQHNYLYAFANPTTFADFLGYWGCCGVDVSIPNPVDAVKSVAGKVADGVQATAEFAWEHRHELLDAAGMVPVIGEVADAANAVLYLAEGDYANAAISLAALVPVGGQAVTGARLAYKGANASTDLVRYSDEVVEAGTNITRRVTNATDTAGTASSTGRATDSAATASRTADTATTASRTDGVVAAPPKSSPASAVDDAVPASTPAAKPASNTSQAASAPAPSTKPSPSGRASTSPGGGPTGRDPIFADNNVLVKAQGGNGAALNEIRSGTTFVTPNQYREFLNVPFGRQARRAFLSDEGIEVFGGPAAGRLASNKSFQKTFSVVRSAGHSRGDAALLAFAQQTGYTAVTAERRLTNFVTHTLQDTTIPIRRLRL